MKTIIPPQQAVLQALGPVRGGGGWRLCQYCLRREVPQGMLLYHLLTRELLLLSPAEWDAALTLPELQARWFIVPEDTPEQEHADLVRWALRAMHKPGPVTDFTILPTTDCNARCFYCYEAGRPRRMMSQETAAQAATHIITQSSGKPVRLRWFGGEPLMNHAAIDAICATLASQGVPFTSSMTTNGLLFTPETIRTAVDCWKLRAVQITLDGTEQTYNRTKAYVGADGSPFCTVLANIRSLLEAGVHVAIRLNVGAHNAPDMLQLAELLARELRGAGSLNVYARALFSTDSWHCAADPGAPLAQLTGRLCELGLQPPARLQRELPLNQCMADSGRARVILPDGRLTLCEHHTEDEIIGHIASPELDRPLMKAWAQQEAPIPACATCPLYPECNRLSKCDTLERCTDESRRAALRSRERSMLAEYQRYLNSQG